jgi:Tfp pilus assembly protein PilF
LPVVVLGVVAVAWVAWERWETHRAGQAAIRLAKNGRFRDAEPALRAALKKEPNNSELLRALALGLFGREDLVEAERVLSHWCQVCPEEVEPYRLRMDVQHKSAQLAKPLAEQQRLKDQALESGRRVIELDPEDDSTARKVVWLCLGSSRFEDADRICRKYLQRQPEDLELLYLQARVCHSLGAAAEAQALLKKLLSHNPHFTPGLLLLAILQYEADDAELAIPLLRRVIAENSGFHKEARYHLGLALGRAGHTEEAQRVLSEVQLENFAKDTAGFGKNENLAVRVRRAELLLARGQAEEALAALEAVLGEDPGFIAAHRLLAGFYSQKGDTVRSTRHRQLAERNGTIR